MFFQYTIFWWCLPLSSRGRWSVKKLWETFISPPTPLIWKPDSEICPINSSDKFTEIQIMSQHKWDWYGQTNQSLAIRLYLYVTFVNPIKSTSSLPQPQALEQVQVALDHDQVFDLVWVQSWPLGSHNLSSSLLRFLCQKNTNTMFITYRVSFLTGSALKVLSANR